MDLLGVPTGGYPIRNLAVLLSDISFSISFVSASNTAGLYDCNYGSVCTIPPTAAEEFLDLNASSSIDELDAFTADPGYLPLGLEDIPGLEVE